MANFLLFVLVFAGQLIGGLSIQKLPPPNDGDTISILSIDAGGIKGIIPARVLDHLDKALKAKDPDASLAHYFDVIAGTSTGGLIATMLASPSPTNANRPSFAPQEIVKFYKDNGPNIFKKSLLPIGPEFSGIFLRSILGELLNETRLNETLTNVVIPAFDIKRRKPVIFSSYKLEAAPFLNAKLSDICIGTSAAPSQLPPHLFWNDGFEFNLIDGGVAAGNPTRAAVSEVAQHTKYTKMKVLSLGTGAENIDAENFWLRLINAIVAFFFTPEIWGNLTLPYIAEASTSMNEHYLGFVYSGYLRVEEYDLPPSLNNPTNVTKENLDGLEEVGKQLLQKNVVKRNLDTFELEKTDEGTNAEALDRLAEFLYEERQQRLRRSKSMEKGGRPFLETLRNPSGQT